jgi:hypothetical protein
VSVYLFVCLCQRGFGEISATVLLGTSQDALPRYRMPPVAVTAAWLPSRAVAQTEPLFGAFALGTFYFCVRASSSHICDHALLTASSYYTLTVPAPMVWPCHPVAWVARLCNLIQSSEACRVQHTLGTALDGLLHAGIRGVGNTHVLTSVQS